MSTNVFLQEMTASVAFFDVRRFSVMCSQLSPMDLGVALGRFYEHVEEGVLEQEGRIVKFFSDAVLALFPSVGNVDHAGRALRMVQRLTRRAPRWLEANLQDGQPSMEYSIGLATGSVLYGQLGTEKLKAFDVLGRPVTLAIKLARQATIRDTAHLVAGGAVRAAEDAPPVIEVEASELGGERVRLYRILTDDEAEGAAPGKD